MKYRDDAEYADGRASNISGQDADDTYTPIESLKAVGAEIVFAATVDTQLLGDSPKWDRVGVVKYATRRSFIEMQSRPDFVSKHAHKDAGMEQTIVIGAQPLASPAAAGRRTGLGRRYRTRLHRKMDRSSSSTSCAFTKGEPIPAWPATRTKPPKIAVPHGVRISGWFAAEGTIVGDGRQWDKCVSTHSPARPRSWRSSAIPRGSPHNGNIAKPRSRTHTR